MSDDDKPDPDKQRLRSAMERAGLLNNEVMRNAQAIGRTVSLAQDNPFRRMMEQMRPNPFELSETTKAIRDWQKNSLVIGEGLKRMVSSFESIHKRMFSAFDWIVEETRKAKLVEESGWLPHETTPFHLFDGETDRQEMSDIIAKHYADEWETVERAFLDRLTTYSIDDEGKDTLREALQAHRQGLFRVAPRLLFPEIERVAADEFYDGNHTTEVVTKKGVRKNPITRLEEVREYAWDLPLGDVTAYEYSWHIYTKVEAHLYETVGDDEAVLARFRADPVPNRHAALHGLVTYNTQKTSLNAIIMTDFMFHLITQIKKYQAEEGETAAEA